MKLFKNKLSIIMFAVLSALMFTLFYLIHSWPLLIIWLAWHIAIALIMFFGYLQQKDVSAR